MSEHIYLLTIGLPLLTLLLIFGMRSWSAGLQARVRIADDQAYRRIAENAVATQAETAATLTAMQSTLLDLRTRVKAIEQILEQVE